MKWLLTSMAFALLAACGGKVATVEPVRYDFGSLPGTGSGSSLPITAVDVQAASWLAGPAMHFRLAYAESQRRQAYVESRWAAPPAELLGAFLNRRMVFARSDISGVGCHLQVTVSEFEQRFDEPQRSVAVLETRALLTSPRGGEMLAQKTFLLNRPAPTPDARGGATAMRDAVQALADDLGNWLGELARDKPAVIERCRN